MSNILLDSLIQDLDPQLKANVLTNPELKQKSQEFLEQLLVNEELLSTDAFTTSNNPGHKTLTEEIAELDDQQRLADLKLANITNENRDLIIDISQDLKFINETITADMKSHVAAILKLFKSDDNKKFEANINEPVHNSIDINSSILSNIDSILDLLELPTLCKICILQGNYQEALEISVLAKTLIVKFPKIVIFHKIYQQIKLELNLMIKNLIKLLNTNLKQNNLIKIFNILAKLDLINFNHSDLINSKNSLERTRFLKIIYFNSRYKYIVNELSNLKPLIKFNKFTYLKRFIEIYRSDIYHSLSMFYTIINHSLNLTSNPHEDDLLINQFIKNLAYELVTALKTYLPQVIHSEDQRPRESKSDSDPDLDVDYDDDIKNQLDGLILQIIYLCKSLSKFSQNFENIIVWELCYKHSLISESDWLNNVSKVDKFRD